MKKVIIAHLQEERTALMQRQQEFKANSRIIGDGTKAILDMYDSRINKSNQMILWLERDNGLSGRIRMR